MFSPKKKMSKSRTAKRTTHWIKLNAKRLLDNATVVYDAKGVATGLSHFVSPITGKYNGKQVIKVTKSKKVKKVRV